MPLGRGSRWWLRCAGPGYVHSAQRLPLDRLRVVRCDLLSCVVGSEFSDPLVSDRGDTISARRTLPTGRGTDSEGLSAGPTASGSIPPCCRASEPRGGGWSWLAPAVRWRAGAQHMPGRSSCCRPRRCSRRPPM